MAEIPECIGPYRVLSVVGEGGMGVVYKAEDPRLERVVALKVIREFDGDDTRRRRFWQEARAAAQVTHPNACRIYDITEERGRLVLVMEFIDGESLAKRLERGFLPAQEAGQVALSVLSALEAFHKIGIVHRDLKPSNIVLANGGTKLLDFGIAKHVALNANEEAAATLGDATAPGIFLGTPKYASPEQFLDRLVDARSDLFSLGVVLFEMLTGQPPFSGETFGEVAHAVLEGSPPALSGSPHSGDGPDRSSRAIARASGPISERGSDGRGLARHAADGWNRDEGASTPITTDHRAAVPDVAAKRRHPVSGVQLAGGNNGLSCWTGKPGGALVDCGGAVFRACA